MKPIQKPKWLLFAEECRAIMEKDRPSKDGRRREDTMRRNWMTACSQYGYEGTHAEWRYLMGFRGRR